MFLIKKRFCNMTQPISTQSSLDSWDLVSLNNSEISFETIHSTSPKELKIAIPILTNATEPKNFHHSDEKMTQNKSLDLPNFSEKNSPSYSEKTCTKICRFFSNCFSLRDGFFFIKKRKN